MQPQVLAQLFKEKNITKNGIPFNEGQITLVSGILTELGIGDTIGNTTATSGSVPEADTSHYLKLVSDLKDAVAQLKDQVNEVTTSRDSAIGELNAFKNIAEEDSKSLRSQIDAISIAKDTEVKALKDQLVSIPASSNNPIEGAITGMITKVAFPALSVDDVVTVTLKNKNSVTASVSACTDGVLTMSLYEGSGTFGITAEQVTSLVKQ